MKNKLTLLACLFLLFSFAFPTFVNAMESAGPLLTPTPTPVISPTPTPSVPIEETPFDDVDKAGTILLYSKDDEEVLYEKDAEKRVAPQNTAKLMTAILAMEHFSDINEIITLGEKDLENTGAGFFNFDAGDKVAVCDLIRTMLAINSNDSARILANLVAGTEDEFVLKMNEKAKEVGCVSTLYKNADGRYNSGAYTTAKDILRIALVAYDHAFIREAVSTAYTTLYSVKAQIYNRNFFISRYYNTKYLYSNATGMNSGYNDNGGYSLVASAEYSDKVYFCIVFEAEYDDENVYSYRIARNLIEWGKDAFEYKTVVNTYDIVCEIPVELGDMSDYAGVYPSSSLDLFMPKDADVENSVKISYKLEKEKLVAPVFVNMPVGKLSVEYKGRLYEIDLVLKTDIEKSSTDYYMTLLSKFIKNETVIRTAIIVVSVIVVYVLGTAFYKQQKKKYYEKRAE